jgi:glycyl-tRNA synthetase beta chain
VMGRYYAIQQSEPQAVYDAIRDHYLPLGPASPVPNKPVSICVALADKLDTLISMFGIGEKPTGSKDPFALRRAALGIIRIILENDLRLPLKQMFVFAPMSTIAIHKAHDKLVKQTEAHLKDPKRIGKYLTVNETASEDIPEGAVEELGASLLAFLHDRLIVQLKESGIRHDVIKAVVSGGDDDLVRIVARAKALQDFLGSEDGKNLLAAYKRAANILSIEEKKDKTTYQAADLKTASLKEKEEKELADLLSKKAGAISKLLSSEDFSKAMTELASLRAPVDAFFDKIMVNADDKELRANRLRLLANIRGNIDAIANFALIEG